MAETGFGSLSFTPQPQYADWGFGSPTPLDLDTGDEYVVGRDTAFGSPYDAVASSVFIAGEFELLPDDGGVMLEIQADWSSSGMYAGAKVNKVLFPFSVFFINSATGDEYPAVGDSAERCETNYIQTKLFAGVPPLPHGTYDIRVEWNGGTRQIYIDNAFVIDVAPRSRQAYGVRQHLPEWWNVGPTFAEVEQISTFDGYSSNLEMITKCIGDALQRLYGAPCTALTSDLAYEDSTVEVESTIGFPETGALSIGGIYFEYTGKTEHTFTGVSSQLYFNTFGARQEVNYALPH